MNYKCGVYFIIENKLEYVYYCCICKMFDINIRFEFVDVCSVYIHESKIIKGKLVSSKPLHSVTAMDIYNNCIHGKKGLIMKPSQYIEIFKKHNTEEFKKYFYPKII